MKYSVVSVLLISVPAVATSVGPCSSDDQKQFPYCNTSLPVIERATDLVSRMTQAEKIGQMVNSAPPIERLGVQQYDWWTECLHGISGSCTHGGRCPTSYPMPIGLGATFNLPLIKKMASQISSEGRRMNVENEAQRKLNSKWHFIGLDFWASVSGSLGFVCGNPILLGKTNLNNPNWTFLFLGSRWGRGMETPGEDPYLNGQYAVNFIKGMQEGEDPRYLKTVATLKHYTAYSVENWHTDDRHSFNAIVSDQDLVQTYLPAFEVGIKEGKAGSVMCAYNAVNGIPACASSFLLQDILRDQWDWDGYVVSDCDAVSDVFNNHNYTKDPASAAAESLKAGCDLDCGNFYKIHMADAIQQNVIKESDLDTALVRLFTAKIKLGEFDPPGGQPYRNYPSETIGHPDHVETALSCSCPMEGLKNAFSGEVVGVKGCDLKSNDTTHFDEAVKAAQGADVAILFMGIDGGIENEGNDRNSIDLPGFQYEFIDAVAKVQSETILVLVNGGSVDISAAKENPNIVSILEAFYPGMKGGEAIADVLLGKYNPSGRLPYTMHKKDFVDQIPMSDTSMTNGPGRTYRYFHGDAIYPVGYGLSYTTFSYKTNAVDWFLQEDGTQTGAKYQVKVTNTGNLAGAASVLAFLSFKEEQNYSSVDFSCPLSQLFGFEKIYLEPGETKKVFVSAHVSALKCFHRTDHVLKSPYGWYQVNIGDEMVHEFLSMPDMAKLENA
ncbi:Exo-1,4-beta-xylosidase bxlB [Seminavis robusta]|uniref:Exo-1,4-beta-xylosidase bxlB n=1 Tax=Seminavis robusta TaxID=568900 RepID=A0A9N8H754_9STRA|nr:Exo-1,4-beta-xylosidase bxlB [Seminavis robusta]|eukprot:Sro119_g058120.1 Exo-1,4-beta-xylosidase bxlB (723) ;mRNA; f:68529-71014